MHGESELESWLLLAKRQVNRQEIQKLLTFSGLRGNRGQLDVIKQSNDLLHLVGSKDRLRSTRGYIRKR